MLNKIKYLIFKSMLNKVKDYFNFVGIDTVKGSKDIYYRST